MKNFRRICFALVLSVAFTMPALAGDIPSTGGPNPGDGHGTGSPDPGDGHSPGSPMTEETSALIPGDGQCPTPAISGDVQSPAWFGIVMIMQDLMF